MRHARSEMVLAGVGCQLFRRFALLFAGLQPTKNELVFLLIREQAHFPFVVLHQLCRVSPKFRTPSLSCASIAVWSDYRKGRKKARRSSASSSGSSSAAKWPPRGISVHRCTLNQRFAHARGAGRMSFGNLAIAAWTSLLPVCCGDVKSCAAS